MPNDVKIGEILQETADAIRDRLNVQQSYYKIKVKDFPQTILDLPEPTQDGSAFDLDAFAGGTISSVETNALYVRSSAFRGCENLVTASFPFCESMGSDVFRFCSALTSFYAPRLTYVPSGTFLGTNLETLDLPACTRIDDYAFLSMNNLISLSLPNCETIGTQFEYNPNQNNQSIFNKLSQVYLPKCKGLG